MLIELQLLQDAQYAEFQKKLLPTLSPDTIIGVRTPQLKALAKTMIKNGTADAFIAQTPHVFFEENQLHAFIISEEKDFARSIAKTQSFLPFVNNWATCDQLSPKAFAKSTQLLLPHIDDWLASPLTYTVRFGVGMLMRYFLDESFLLEYAQQVAGIKSDEYYINMMIAWYFATALAKQYSSVLPFFINKTLPRWTHNKAIQKAKESYRVSEEHKAFLSALKY